MATRSLNRLFVSNLPWTVGHRELLEYFSQYGYVGSARVAFDKSTGVSRGYGFVEFPTRSDYENALGKKDRSLEGNFVNVKPSSN